MGAQWEPGRVAGVCVVLSQSAGKGSWHSFFFFLIFIYLFRLCRIFSCDMQTS